MIPSLSLLFILFYFISLLNIYNSNVLKMSPFYHKKKKMNVPNLFRKGHFEDSASGAVVHPLTRKPNAQVASMRSV